MSGFDSWDDGPGVEVTAEQAPTLRLCVSMLAAPEQLEFWKRGLVAEGVEFTRYGDSGAHFLLVDERYPQYDSLLQSMTFETPETLPLIFFLLDSGEEPDCVRAFMHGAYDYIHLPISPAALASRLKRVWGRYIESSQIKQQLSESSVVAMQSMSMNAELGLILQFMERCFDCADFQQTATAALKLLNDFGLRASLIISHDRGLDFYSDDGTNRNIEQEVLETSRNQGRLYHFGTRTVVNFPNVGILIRNMPIADSVRYGVVKDHLCFVASGLQARVAALILELRSQARATRVQTTVVVLQKIISEMELAKLALVERSSEELEAMLINLTSAFSELSLTSSEEQRLSELLNDAHSRVNDLFMQSTEQGNNFRRILSQLAETLKR